ncbi:MAG: 1-acyl-sn-glycerol-3-phosphate acyltransferase [Clostridia bacterium]|nr:1-acyl-sn-glycerol-3-phosphate acyltransferase [Clostridia bacterium]
MEKLPKDGRFVFVGNHISNYDPIITWYALRKYDLAFISKESNFNIPIFGRIIRKCCFMSIDRTNPKNAVKTITRASGLIKADEVSMAVYPEGTRNKTQDVLLPFHNVVFKIAQKPQVPIVVASTYGTNKIAGRTPFRRTHVYLDILNVLPAEEVLQSRTAEIGSTVTRIITENLEKYTIGEKDEKLLHIV